MINLLFILKDTSKSLDRNYFFFEQELSKWTDLVVWRESGRISSILQKIKKKPDFILVVNDVGDRIFPIIKGLSSIDIPSGLIVNDVHRFTELRRNFIKKNNIQHIFSIARGKFYESYPEYKHKMEWFPHFVNTDIYKDYFLKKEIDLLMMGAVNDVYPLRKKVLETYRHDSCFVYHEHPGYSNLSEEGYINERYAREINRSKIFFTCPSIYKYPVMKYYEVLACNTLLLAPNFKELEDLGFIAGTHFVDINESNFKRKGEYYLKNKIERKRIAQQGYRFVNEQHSIQVRVRQFINKICELINNG
ncbi:glycosyltransferase [Metabacillus fastidiosus]|uniref:glycosyltransferase n=1 Tax=Metabacillus fastidiosus TaxID=1458 RepID=UPI002DBAE2D6|nr:glycosyltransferase [Metabacillus fastidiosus]MEC2077079.1 glycosyltransferase [Metabacillus fastidiosus]